MACPLQKVWSREVCNLEVVLWSSNEFAAFNHDVHWTISQSHIVQPRCWGVAMMKLPLVIQTMSKCLNWRRATIPPNPAATVLHMFLISMIVN